jgi:poly(A) polymerase
VRDTLMGVATADTEVDMATDLSPEKVMARLQAVDIKVVPTGIKHGTVSAIIHQPDTPLVYEITTLRVDLETDGRHAEVAFTQDWQGDAARRDFTINALYADADARLHDPTGQGLGDIAARHVRFIGDAAARIEEDYLRVLRYFRFHYRLTPDAAPEPAALAACQAAAAGLRGLSGERKQQEMLKIMALPNALAAGQAMQAAGLLRPILGAEPVEFAMLAQMVGRTRDPLLRLMALLPTADAGHVMAATLRFSKKQKMRFMTALERPLDVAHLRAALYFDGPQAVADRAHLALAAGQGREADLQAALEAADGFTRPTFPLTGAMMQKAGIENGPAMGVMSKALEDWWVSEGFPDATAVEAELKRRV